MFLRLHDVNYVCVILSLFIHVYNVFKFVNVTNMKLHETNSQIAVLNKSTIDLYYFGWYNILAIVLYLSTILIEYTKLLYDCSSSFTFCDGWQQKADVLMYSVLHVVMSHSVLLFLYLIMQGCNNIQELIWHDNSHILIKIIFVYINVQRSRYITTINGKYYIILLL